MHHFGEPAGECNASAGLRRQLTSDGETAKVARAEAEERRWIEWGKMILLLQSDNPVAAFALGRFCESVTRIGGSASDTAGPTLPDPRLWRAAALVEQAEAVADGDPNEA